MRWNRLTALAVLVPALFIGCGGPSDDAPAGPDTQDAAAAPQPNPLRNAYFGDLHVHTRF